MAKLDALVLETDRLLLKYPTEPEFPAFAAMHADPIVMHDYPAIPSEDESRDKWNRYLRIWDAHGHGRWMVMERATDNFLGYVGINPMQPDLGVQAEWEIGWRMVRSAWGHGYATEAARAALADGFARCGLTEVIAATTAHNTRSQAVMRRLLMRRVSELDFRWPDSKIEMLVWCLPASRSPSPPRKRVSHLAKLHPSRKD